MLDKTRYDGQDITIYPNKAILTTPKGTREKEINITLKEIRDQLIKIGNNCPYGHDNYSQFYSSAVEKYGLPYMNYVYYFLFFQQLKVPTFQEFFDMYVYLYCDVLPNGLYTVKNYFDPSDFCFTKEALMGRIYRSYNSFHRELEFLFQFKEYDDISIWYDFQDDLNGIDFTVIYKGVHFGLATYIASENSYQWKQRKNNVRHDYSNLNIIDIVAKFKKEDPDFNCVSRNGIFTYSPKFVAKKYFEIIKAAEKILNV